MDYGGNRKVPNNLAPLCWDGECLNSSPHRSVYLFDSSPVRGKNPGSKVSRFNLEPILVWEFLACNRLRVIFTMV